MFGLNKKKEIDSKSRINYFEAKKTIDHIKSCHNSDVQKVVLLKDDKPSNYNSKTKTIYVNQNDTKQYEKLKNILVKPKNKPKMDYPKKNYQRFFEKVGYSRVSNEDIVKAKKVLEEYPDYKAYHGTDSIVLYRGTNKVQYLKDGRFYSEKIDYRPSQASLKMKADFGPPYDAL